MSRLVDLDFYSEHFDRLLLTLFALGVAAMVGSAFLGTEPDVIVGDARDYFEYARSLVATGSLPSVHIKYPCGVALIGATGYLPAAGLARLLVALGVLTPSARIESGWAVPLQVAFCIPFLLLSFVAFRANVATFVRLGFPPRVVRPMVLFWIITTNVGFYVLKEPALSEGGTYATLSLYYWTLIRWFYVPPAERGVAAPHSATISRALVAGLFLGLAGTIRQQNILHAVAMPLLLATQSQWLFGGGRDAVIRAARAVGAAALSSAALFILPWLAWYAADGQFRFFSYGEEHFNFLAPHPLDALLHPGYHGLFVWHPAFAIAAGGLVLFLRRHRDLRAAWMTPVAVQFYLIASWYWLSFGASIGHRGFFTILPLLLAGWIAAGNAMAERGKSATLLGGVAALAVANAMVTALLVTGRWSSVGLPPR